MKSKLSKLGYTNKWKELNILDDQQFNRQFIEFKKGEDTNTEHYRHKTLCDWMDKKAEFSSEELYGIIKLLKDDEDISMATAAYFRLYEKETVSYEQKEFLEKEWAGTNALLKKLIENKKLSKKIKAGDISVELFEDCFRNGKMLRLIIMYTKNNDYLERLMAFAKKTTTKHK